MVCGDWVSLSLLGSREARRLQLPTVPPPQKILIFSISKWRVLVYSVALNLTFWLQQKVVKITH